MTARTDLAEVLDAARAATRTVTRGDDVGAMVRGYYAIGRADPFSRLMALGGDWARLVDGARGGYYVAHLSGSEIVRAECVGAIDRLLGKLRGAVAGATAAERETMLKLLAAQRHELADGWRAGAVAQQVAEAGRAVREAARAASRPAGAGEAVVAIENRVRPAVLAASRPAVRDPSSTAHALGIVARTLPLHDRRAWLPVYERIRSLGLVPDGPAAMALRARARSAVARGADLDRWLREHLRGNLNNLKGLANELSFYHSPDWSQTFKPGVEHHASLRARTFGREYRPLLVEEPLFLVTEQGPKEILDGAGFVVKPLTRAGDLAGGVAVFDGVLDVGISAKLERERGVTVLGAIAEDIRRLALDHPGTPIVYSRDRSVVIVLRPPPDQQLPSYIAVANELPSGFKRDQGLVDFDLRPGPRRLPAGYTRLPGGVPVIFTPTAYDAVQGESAFVEVLKAVIGLP